jgi:NADH:ubiquinone oxidoreductase subunit 5 (subunit L)/multisubunit Na+/H+ antiporter MnhA subunit
MAKQVGCLFNEGTMFYWLAVIAALNSAVSLYYYARIVRKMFLEKSEDETPYPLDIHARSILWPVSILLLVGGIYWTPLWNATVKAVDFQRPTLAEIQYKTAEPEKAKESASIKIKTAGPNGQAQAVVKE